MNCITDTDVLMTSRDIAEITGKQHAHVMRDIRNEIFQLGNVGLSIFGESTYMNSQNKLQPQYVFGREGAMQLALKYNAVIRHKVIRKLTELESKNALPTYSEALRLYADQIEKNQELEQQNTIMKPKALFADTVSASEDAILVRELSKILQQAGVDTGEKRLFEWMRANGYLIRKAGRDRNLPTQRSMEMGLFRVKETARHTGTGDIKLDRTPLVTGKGQQYFVKKFVPDIIDGIEVY